MAPPPAKRVKMAPPPAKRVKIDLDPQKDIKIDPEPNKPIIFTTPDTQPDCRLRVFNQDFLVYSGLLKINSAFFRKFLDPSSGKIPASSEVYKYEWFTCVDKSDSNCWFLTNDPEFRDASTATGSFTGSSQIHQEAFRKLLCAIFSRTYEINNCYELQVMTKHAEYYCALPILSISLWGPLVNSPSLIPSIGPTACHTLIAAYKLRHKQLFNDSFILVLGPWKTPRYHPLKDLEPKLFQMAEAAHAKMRLQLLKVQQGMFEIFADIDGNLKDTAKTIVGLAEHALDNNNSVALPRYFRLCYDHKYKSDEGQTAVRKLLGPLLKKNLVLDKSTNRAGQGPFKDFFLSFQVDKYPWDESQIDW